MPCIEVDTLSTLPRNFPHSIDIFARQREPVRLGDRQRLGDFSAGFLFLFYVPAMDKIDKIVRQRITESFYWKRHCFALNAATLCDKAAELSAVGGLHANSRPTPFLCLVYKLVLINPEREIIEEILHQPHFKYLTAIAAVFVRLMYPAADAYTLLEPLLADYRKLRWQTHNDEKLRHMDELADLLLDGNRAFDLTFTRLPPRIQLEDRGLLGPPLEFV